MPNKLQATKIFDGTTNKNSETVTGTFSNAKFLIINTPDLDQSLGDQGYDIAYLLVSKIEAVTNIGGIDIKTSYGEKEYESEIAPLFFGTLSMLLIPDEIGDLGNDLYLVLNTTHSIRLEIYAISKIDCCQQTLEAIQNVQNSVNAIQALQVVTNVANILTEVASLAVQAEISTVLAAGLALPTAGASLALPPAVAATEAPALPALATAGVALGLAIPGLIG